MRRNVCLVRVLLAAVALTSLIATAPACAKARHVAVIADATVAEAVFAFDDAEWTAFKTGAIAPAVHDRLNPIIRKALKDVRAVTAALQATPSTTAPPVTIADVLQDLADADAIVRELAASPSLAPVIASLQRALQQARQFTGGH